MKDSSSQSKLEMQPLFGGYPFGRFEHAFDVKKRLTVPAAWRDMLGHPRYLYIIRNPKEQCLTILAPDEMRQRMERLKGGSLFDPKLSAAWRYIGENSEMISVDSTGRIRISDRLLNAVGLTDKVVFIGMGNKMEVWPLSLKPAEPKFDSDTMLDAFTVIGL